MGRLFGTDGVRGIVNEQLTPELALRLGMAFGTFLGEGARVLVGRDVRCGGDMLVHAVIAGLQASGCKVYYAGYAPTPAIQYNVKVGGFDGGVVVTASHNPPQYNGIKVISARGIEISREEEREVEEIYFTSRFRLVEWRRLVEDAKPYPQALDVYVNGVLEHVDDEVIRGRGFRVVVDAANSVGALATPQVLRRLGVKVLCINCNLDPTFPAREPEPTPETLRDAREAVRMLKADLGVGHDGDADRAIIIDEAGEAWWGDRSGALLAAYAADVKGLRPRRAYTAVSSSILVEEYLSKHGVEVVWTPVGAINISYRLLREGGCSGFEENGGYIHPPHQLVRDGAMKVALFLEMMAREGEPASRLFARLPRYYAVKTKVPLPDRSIAERVLEEVKKLYKNYRMVTIDGVKVFGDGWWFLVRPSGTEPVMRIMVEARSREEAERLAEELKKLVEDAIKRILSGR